MIHSNIVSNYDYFKFLSGTKLKEASDQQQYNHNVEDFDVCLSETEGQQMSEDQEKVG